MIKPCGLHVYMYVCMYVYIYIRLSLVRLYNLM